MKLFNHKASNDQYDHTWGTGGDLARTGYMACSEPDSLAYMAFLYSEYGEEQATPISADFTRVERAHLDTLGLL